MGAIYNNINNDFIINIIFISFQNNWNQRIQENTKYIKQIIQSSFNLTSLSCRILSGNSIDLLPCKLGPFTEIILASIPNS